MRTGGADRAEVHDCAHPVRVRKYSPACSWRPITPARHFQSAEWPSPRPGRPGGAAARRAPAPSPGGGSGAAGTGRADAFRRWSEAGRGRRPGGVGVPVGPGRPGGPGRPAPEGVPPSWPGHSPGHARAEDVRGRRFEPVDRRRGRFATARRRGARVGAGPESDGVRAAAAPCAPHPLSPCELRGRRARVGRQRGRRQAALPALPGRDRRARRQERPQGVAAGQPASLTARSRARGIRRSPPEPARLRRSWDPRPLTAFTVPGAVRGAVPVHGARCRSRFSSPPVPSG